VTKINSAARWLRGVFSPSDPAWTAAAYALLTLWGLLFASFFFSDGAPDFMWESMDRTPRGVIALDDVGLAAP
jgi:hypothetical protein